MEKGKKNLGNTLKRQIIGSATSYRLSQGSRLKCILTESFLAKTFVPICHEMQCSAFSETHS